MAQSDETPAVPERRESHRIRYPLLERPSLLIQDGSEQKTCIVLDISVQGLCCAIAKDDAAPCLQEPVKGVLQFQRGARINIEGTVVRVSEHEFALHLRKEIPFGILLGEQQYLRRHYPMWT